ncbi:EthD domain-containing protein [Kutzneria sp. NPDC052558]|uniref:EthD domain-containing protein n=1 Tax=Kutzneria sp. NPDC052558 TaxID=3364121 RepID=UPI0037CBE55D
MIKITYALRRRPELSPEEFHRYWRTEHAALVLHHAAAIGLRRYVQSHTVTTPVDAPLRAARSPDPEPYDGVAELYFDDLDALISPSSPEDALAAGIALVEDERRFIDLSRSPIWLSEEHVILDTTL